jgi:hypothetical protein
MGDLVRRHARRPRRRERPQGWGPLLLALLLLLALAPVVAHAQGTDSVTVRWTAPGDDARVGTATAYELKWSTTSIDESNWSDSKNIVAAAPTPLVAGTRQSTVVRGLTRGTTYWFAIKTLDDAGNWSFISNVVRWDWVLDTAPPGAPTGVSAAIQGGGSARVSWSPNSEADLAGYEVYRAVSAAGPYAAINPSLVLTNEYVDDTIPPGTETVWYQVTARDNSGNESARSSAYSLSLVAQTSAWVMETGYPNPSARGTTVRIPLVVPSSAGEARLEIVNDSGQRVRRLDLGTLGSGANEVTWDGRNESGHEVAPGVYTAWLTAGATRLSSRLVRLP